MGRFIGGKCSKEGSKRVREVGNKEVWRERMKAKNTRREKYKRRKGKMMK